MYFPRILFVCGTFMLLAPVTKGQISQMHAFRLPVAERTISLSIVDEEGEALSMASVSAEETGIMVVSDMYGRCQLLIPPGIADVHLFIARNGYNSLLQTLHLAGNQNPEITITLKQISETDFQNFRVILCRPEAGNDIFVTGPAKLLLYQYPAQVKGDVFGRSGGHRGR